MRENRGAWVVATASMAVALVACVMAMSSRLEAQEPEPVAGDPVVALPVDGSFAVEPAMIDPAATEAALGTAITYQGILRSGSAPASGTYDFQFQLFNAATGGAQRGATLLADNVTVTSGRFTTILDFGNVFGDEALWLAIGVRAGTSTGAFTALNPRQTVTPAPYARYAVTAGNATALQTRVATLETQVAALQTLLAGVSRVDSGETIRITGANLQVVSGSGATDGVSNGLGNVIIGYNEPHPEYPNSKTGSHYLVVGKGNGYELHGGIVAGESNYVYGWYSSILGGTHNEIDADYAAIVGGQYNKTWNGWSTVAGGRTNEASGQWSSVAGGFGNKAIGNYSFVAGGYENRATGNFSVVSGGADNQAQALYATVSGGNSNNVQGAYSTIGGGFGVTTGTDSSHTNRWYVNNQVPVPNLFP